jgi:hypothetical protein
MEKTKRNKIHTQVDRGGREGGRPLRPARTQTQSADRGRMFSSTGYFEVRWVRGTRVTAQAPHSRARHGTALCSCTAITWLFENDLLLQTYCPHLWQWSVRFLLLLLQPASNEEARCSVMSGCDSVKRVPFRPHTGIISSANQIYDYWKSTGWARLN